MTTDEEDEEEPFDIDRFNRLISANAHLGRDVDQEVASFDRDSLEALIVERIVIDLADRRGLKHVWYTLDRDIRKEIEATWRLIIRQVLRDSRPM